MLLLPIMARFFLPLAGPALGLGGLARRHLGGKPVAGLSCIFINLFIALGAGEI